MNTTTHRRPRMIAVLLVALPGLFALACSQASAPTIAPEVPAPVPGPWQITEDFVAPRDQVDPIATQLGGDIAGLRNTKFTFGDGKFVQVNAIQAVTVGDADAIYASIANMKPEEFLVRRGTLIFEFVGSNDVIADMREAAAMLREAPSA